MKTKTICLIGASGFVGQHLVRALRQSADCELRLLQHRKTLPADADVQIVHGDLGDRASLEQFLIPGATLVNLAYPGEAVGSDAARVLAQACREKQIRRLVHLSTAMVVGDSKAATVSEETPCAPSDGYGKAKLEIEKILLDASAGGFELIILRPTAIFGPGGLNLVTLARRVALGSLAQRMLWAIFMGHRRMHALDVDAAIGAILLAISAILDDPRQTLIIADDEHPLNNYRDIEACLAAAMEAPPLPRCLPSLPDWMLRPMLRILRKPDTQPNRVFSANKLHRMGFRMPRDLGLAVGEYARWFLQHPADEA